MRDYAKVSPRFWLGETGRELRKAGAEAQVVAFYLMTSPHANMLGLYYLPVLYLAHEADQVVPENTGQPVGRVDYPDVFEQVWREYPLRAGANPKKSAFSAWKARLREGVPPEAMLDGVRRYARYLATTGKTGTEFVQRATTFFGPDRNFENPWLLPVSGTNNQRCVNHVSEPDTEIPPGFRG
ncbi:hypothetical protein ABU498_004766 [Escherichia coli]